jgi:hypothetical protein
MNIDRIAPLAIGIALAIAAALGLGHAAHALDTKVDSHLEQVQR